MLKLVPNEIAGNASALAPLVVVRFESVVVPPIAPPSVIAAVPAVSVSACVFAVVPLIVELKLIAPSVVESEFTVTVAPSVTAPVNETGPAAASALVLTVPPSVIAVAVTETPPVRVRTCCKLALAALEIVNV